jgi:cyclic-di-GMP-binding protein
MLLYTRSLTPAARTRAPGLSRFGEGGGVHPHSRTVLRSHPSSLIPHMAQESSFDIVSKADLQEVRNAVDQAQREIGTRFDFKNSVSEIEFDGEAFKLISDDEYRMTALVDVLQSKLVRRGVDLLHLDYGKVEPVAKNTVRQEIKLKQGVETEKAKEIVRLIKGTGRKVNAQIQGDAVRVSGKNKDDLQAVIQLLKGQSLGVPLQFINYR